jgi:hypothetical protein
MTPVWRKVKDGWTLLMQGDEPDHKEKLVWRDTYLQLYQRIYSGRITYRIRVDRRRVYEVLKDPQWITLFFGRDPDVSVMEKGDKVWRDRYVIVQKFGDSPRSYVIVAR